jgi:O-antigen/teichoic acid export membrane protein
MRKSEVVGSRGETDSEVSQNALRSTQIRFSGFRKRLRIHRKRSRIHRKWLRILGRHFRAHISSERSADLRMIGSDAGRSPRLVAARQEAAEGSPAPLREVLSLSVQSAAPGGQSAELGIEKSQGTPLPGSRRPSTSTRGQSVTLVAVRMLSLAAAFVSSLVLARILGSTKYGGYSTAASIAGLVTVVGAAGQDQLFLRGTIASATFRSRLRLIGLYAALGVFGAALLWPRIGPTIRVAAILLASSLAINTVAFSYVYEPQRRLEFARRGRREFTQRLAISVSPLMAAILTGSVIGVSVGALAGSLIFAIPAWFDLRRFPLPKIESVTPTSIRAGLPFATSGVLYALQPLLPPLALSLVGTTRNVGQLRLGITLLVAMQTVPLTMNNEILRSKVYQNMRDDQDPKPQLRRGLVTTLIVGFGLGSLAVVLGPAAVTFMYGHEFGETGTVIRTLGCVFPLYCLSTWAGTILVISGKEKLGTIRQGVAIATMVPALGIAMAVSPTPESAAIVLAVNEVIGLLVYLVNASSTIWKQFERTAIT